MTTTATQPAYLLPVIGHVRSCFQQKFGTPRQPGLVQSAQADIVLLPGYSDLAAIEGLQEFSHMWLVFYFHLSAAQGWKSKVRPPRLGGNRSLGVFATRSPFRPCPIGISAVELKAVTYQAKRIRINCSGIDLVDGTPILDIKPYLPYTDSQPDAEASYADQPPASAKEVFFAAKAELVLTQLLQPIPNLRALIEETLALDPRPSYKTKVDPKLYSLALYNLDIKWRLSNSLITVEDIIQRNSDYPEYQMDTD